MKRHGPWKILKSVQKYKNSWMEVKEETVIQPNGKKGIFGLTTIKDGVSVLPFDGEGFVYLVQEFKYALGRVTLETVSGGIDAGENPLRAAKRELKEETGIEADEWISLGRVDPFTSAVKSSADLFLARKLRLGAASQDGTEMIQVKKIPMAEAVGLVMDSTITHAQGCVLILKAAKFLGKL